MIEENNDCFMYNYDDRKLNQCICFIYNIFGLLNIKTFLNPVNLRHFSRLTKLAALRFNSIRQR